jgi:anthranilate synthase
LNEKGKTLIRFISLHLKKQPHLFKLNGPFNVGFDGVSGIVNSLPEGIYFPEEERSKQPSLFTLVRSIREIFAGSDAGQLGLYGSFGYDLAFQFEPIVASKERDASQRDLLLYLPDEIVVIDNQKNDAWKVLYEFSDMDSNVSTKGMDRIAAQSSFQNNITTNDKTILVDRPPAGNFANSVLRAKKEFKVGNLFEVVLSQMFKSNIKVKPSVIFERFLFTFFFLKHTIVKSNLNTK